jgi:hypothetical protein
MNGYWILPALIYFWVAASKMLYEHRRGSRLAIKIACLFWLPLLTAALFITILQHVFEEHLR